jgi:quercetin dioxygenase-like cupin family protein
MRTELAMEAIEGVGQFDDLPWDEPFPGVRRAMFSTQQATVSRYTFEPGAAFPPHSHAQEQITLVQEGDLEMSIAGEITTLRKGGWSVVGPDVEHGITAGPEGTSFLAVIVPRRGAADEYVLATPGGGA